MAIKMEKTFFDFSKTRQTSNNFLKLFEKKENTRVLHSGISRKKL